MIHILIGNNDSNKSIINTWKTRQSGSFHTEIWRALSQKLITIETEMLTEKYDFTQNLPLFSLVFVSFIIILKFISKEWHSSTYIEYAFTLQSNPDWSTESRYMHLKNILQHFPLTLYERKVLTLLIFLFESLFHRNTLQNYRKLFDKYLFKRCTV